MLIAAGAVMAGLVAQSIAAPSNGDKKPPKTKVKQFDVVTLASGFRKPTSVSFAPDGTMFVSQKAGRVYSVTPDGTKRLLLDFSKKIPNGRERGMGSLAVAPDFNTSRRIYLSYTYLANPARPDGPQAMRVTSITLNPDGTLANPGNPETVILGKDADHPCPPVSNKHRLPALDQHHPPGRQGDRGQDGTLWVSSGDSNLPSNPGKQDFRTYNPASTAGKILHVDQHGNGLPDHPFCQGDHDLDPHLHQDLRAGVPQPVQVHPDPDRAPAGLRRRLEHARGDRQRDARPQLRLALLRGQRQDAPSTKTWAPATASTVGPAS